MSSDDPYRAQDFRFRTDNRHNRDMLEYHAEKAHLAGNTALAAFYAQSAGLYAIAVALLREE